jgi:hypothetical protein
VSKVARIVVHEVRELLSRRGPTIAHTITISRIFGIQSIDRSNPVKNATCAELRRMGWIGVVFIHTNFADSIFSISFGFIPDAPQHVVDLHLAQWYTCISAEPVL